MIKYYIVILNDSNSLPTFDSTIGKSWIDLIMFRDMDMNKVGDFMVPDEISMSDHNLITFKLKNKRSRKVGKIYK